MMWASSLRDKNNGQADPAVNNAAALSILRDGCRAGFEMSVSAPCHVYFPVFTIKVQDEQAGQGKRVFDQKSSGISLMQSACLTWYLLYLLHLLLHSTVTNRRRFFVNS